MDTIFNVIEMLFKINIKEKINKMIDKFLCFENEESKLNFNKEVIINKLYNF